MVKSLNINQLQQNQYFTYSIKINLKKCGLCKTKGNGNTKHKSTTSDSIPCLYFVNNSLDCIYGTMDIDSL